MNDEQLADQAAPLDALLVDAALGPLRRYRPDASTVRFAAGLVRRPRTTARRLRQLVADAGHIALGSPEPTPSPRDRRFTDPAWASNPFLRRAVQLYLATGRTLEQLVGDAELDWRDDTRVRFFIDNLLAAGAPSNVPLVNPASAKAAIDSGGRTLATGASNLLRDMARPPRVPQMVDTSGFTVGDNIAATPGAVVLRTEQFELIQFTPTTPQVHEIPLLIVPPTINKYYALDLAPGRSLIEYLVGAGQQVFIMSWRNPDGRHAAWGLDTYAEAVIAAIDAVEAVSGVDRTELMGVCSGGIIAGCTAAHLAAIGGAGRLAALVLLVTVLDQARAGTPAAIVDPSLAGAAKRISRRRGYLDGRALAEVFAWLRPDDLVWNYVVNNYLLGKKPPAFDILFWNSDTTRMTAQLHADFVDMAMDNRLVTPGAQIVLGTPVDLSSISVDAFVVAGVSDHITPWANCYQTTQMLGGETDFVLSNSGHIAALVNPPSNPKASYRVNKANPPTANEWAKTAEDRTGSWWPHLAEWLADRSGADHDAAGHLGGGGLVPLVEAPGTYVLES
jgi:polyhydroxyalkanoate synthase subunit PhaC